MDIYVQKDGQRVGPLPETKIRQCIDAGELAPADLAWTTGKASWQPLSALIDLDVNQPPPISDPTRVDAADHGFVEPPRIKTLAAEEYTRQNLKSVSIVIEDDSFSINGTAIPIPTDAHPLDQLVGTPRWRSPHQYFWDDYGILAWGRDRKKLSSFTIYLRSDPSFGRDYSPKQPFSGELIVGGVSVTAETKIQELVAKKRGLKLVEGSTDMWSNTKPSIFRNLFGPLNPSIGLSTTHEDTISSLWFAQRG